MFSQRSSSSRRRLSALTGGAERDLEPSDQELVEAIALRNDRVAGHLHRRLVPVIDRAIFRVLGYRGLDHDDLIQATFEQVVLTIHRGTYHHACSLTTWASAIASRIGLNALRSRRRERSALDTVASYEQVTPAGASMEAQLDARAEVERVRCELASMKAAQSEAVFLHDILGYALPDIARMCGITSPAAQSRLLRGRHELYRRMGWSIEERS